MRAAYINDLGDAATIRVGELADAVAGEGQVLVHVEAVAVDAVDTYLRSGRWRTEVSFPLVLGRDLVGTVAAVGPGITDVELGQRVWTNSAGYGGRPGATAELVAVYRDRLYPLPPGADPVTFVAALHPGATAHGALLGRARLQPGETVAVVGANGAVGMCMVQVAAASGASAVGVVRDASSTERLGALGATHVAVSDAGHAPSAARAFATDGVDVLIDTTGRVDVAAMPDILNPRGRIVLIAGQGRLNLDAWRFYTREIQLLSFVMSRMTAGELAAAASWINTRYAESPLAVSVGRVLSFGDAAEAHTIVESGRLPRMADGTIGRLVLQP